jgi:branched-chain amino acid transport system ATP-binding protein
MPQLDEPTPSNPLLQLQGVEVYYEGIIRALTDVSLEVGRGQIVCLLGANGAGKSTTLKAVSGLLGAERGLVTAGSVRLSGESVASLRPAKLVERGVVQVIEGRRCFQRLSVEENLLSGTLNANGLFAFTARKRLHEQLDQVYTWIPQLGRHRTQLAGLLSGGQQQLLAIGRALMASPSLLLLDEPSMGLAPLMVEEVFDLVAQLNQSSRLSVLVAEQNARIALRYAHHGYVLETGHIATSGSARELLARDDVQTFYLGLNHRRATEPQLSRPSA